MTANLVLHWHLDALTSNNQVTDSSDNHLAGTVSGQPGTRPDDRFGSVLAFDGTTVQVTGAETPLLRLGSYTVEAWVNPSAKRATRVGVVAKAKGDFAVVLDADGTLRHRFDTTAKAGDGHATAPGAVPTDTWHHVACVNDGRTARIYVDGVKASEYAFAGDRAATQSPLLVGTDGTGRYTGLLAHVRIYDNALSQAEIQRDMADDEAALAAFVRAHPLDFALLDVDQQPVLFIDDAPAGQPMTLRLTNTSRQDIELRTLTGPVSATEHHVALRLRQGTITVPPEPAVATSGWTLLRAPDPATGGTVLYLGASKSMVIARGTSFDLSLRGLTADGSRGTRGTRVELTHQRMRYAGEQSELTGQRTAFLDIVNRRGRRDIPLAIGFVGGNRVLSDGVTQNTLNFRITNRSRDTALSLAGASFTLSYDLQVAGETHEWALAKADATTGASLGGLKVNGVSADWPITSEKLGQRVQWTLTPPANTALGPNGTLVVTLSNVVALDSLGQASVVIGYRNIPGYQDGSVTLLAEKSPLMFGPQATGVGTVAPQAKLHIVHTNQDANGNTLILGPTTQPHLRLGYHQDYSWVQSHGLKPLAINPIASNVGVGTVAPQAKLHIVSANQDANGGTLVLGPTTQPHLRLGYHQNYSWVQSHGAKPLAINPIGNNVGIGTTTPGARLTVSADSSHLELRRESNAAGGKKVYLELYQETSAEPTYPSLRFHHGNRFWHRIEARTEGLMFKTGDLNSDALSDVYANTAVVNALRIGNFTIGADELQLLQSLTQGGVWCSLENEVVNGYFYADQQPFDGTRRHIHTRSAQHDYGAGWRITFFSK
ncbi:LamG domain-containing protein [Streptomyces sp. ME02-8801-2C]|uniref:LamG domain-containing protein n=1 Tax=Streptomyces sp. ME02-8801-2C TaxID=3028680 RepID=UPI0029B35ED4|nr:LamG domain-containing protein [Streptomyces sp. ME02-8801-2C]MDX3451886.1 LamG domain-containing protein [Streptomyces sp. ME02-8801-2C]